MSRLETGQLGRFKGKIGQVVVYKWRGIDVGRKSPTKSSAKPSEKQLKQRQKFGSVGTFLRILASEIAIGWATDKKGVTAINEAVEYHYANALKGDYLDYEIVLEKLLVSRGRGVIDGGFAPLATAAPEGTIDITWITCSSTSRRTQPTDRLMVVLLDEHARPGRVLPVHFERIAQRSDLKVRLTVPTVCLNHPLHAYMFFASEKGKLASESEYLGMVTPRK